MRHRKSHRPLGRNRSHRRAMLRNLVTSLVLHERIETTEAKGKELRVLSDQMISLGIAGDIASRRAAASYLQDPKAVSHLFADLAPLFKPSEAGSTVGKGGYTRLIKTRIRYGDAAPMVIVEFTKRSVVADSPTPPEKPVPTEAAKSEKVVPKKSKKKEAETEPTEAVKVKKPRVKKAAA